MLSSTYAYFIVLVASAVPNLGIINPLSLSFSPFSVPLPSHSAAVNANMWCETTLHLFALTLQGLDGNIGNLLRLIYVPLLYVHVTHHYLQFWDSDVKQMDSYKAALIVF